MQSLILLPVFLFLVTVPMLIHPGEAIPKDLKMESFLFYLAKFLAIACSVGLLRNIYQSKNVLILFVVYLLCIITITSITITVLMVDFY